MEKLSHTPTLLQSSKQEVGNLCEQISQKLDESRIQGGSIWKKPEQVSIINTNGEKSVADKFLDNLDDKVYADHAESVEVS